MGVKQGGCPSGLDEEPIPSLVCWPTSVAGEGWAPLAHSLA